MQWTAGQQAAIDARNDSVLVSAAAGSGKTAVLVERVLSLLREGGRVDRMLIVTFTRAAAGEMRERIGRRLDEEGAKDAHLRRQSMRLNRAAICTLHVFCHRVLREHFQAVGIDPLCRIGEPEKLDALYKRAQDEVLESAYAQPTEDERALFDQFEDQQVVALLNQLYTFLLAQASPWAWAEAQCEEGRAALSAWLPLLNEISMQKLSGAAELMPEMEALARRPDGPDRYIPMQEHDAALNVQLMEQAQAGMLTGGKTAFERLSTKKPGPAENPDIAEEYKELREEWKARVNEAREALPVSAERAEQDLRHALPVLRALCGLAKRTHERFFELKQRKNLLDYSDLEHLTLKALNNPDVRCAVAGSFDALFIDEYQDVSGIQEAILRALHEGFPNLLFMVGDVKQSIYRFRLADPTLFLEKYRAYSLEETAKERKILLQQNFRSDENVLLAVNEVFAHAMREKETEIAYDEAAMLRPGGGQPFGAPVEIHLMVAQAEEAEEEAEASGELSQGYRYEAAFVAKKIKELMRFATVREGSGSRPLRYRDIALLMRYASGRAPYIARALQTAGIPVYSDADAQFFDLPEVADMLNLLRVIDNPLQDIPLLATLRCPCFQFTEEELARIRLIERTPGTPFHIAFQTAMGQESPLGQKAKAAWERLSDWRFKARHLPVDALIWRILDESGLYMRAGCQEEGELRQANLRLLVERAQGDNGREGLGVFLKDMGRLRASDDGAAAKTLGENEDVVRILTLHKSKGLEFPVVFLMEMARPFRKGDGGLLRLHGKYGMGLQYVDVEQRVTRETCAQKALSYIQEKEARAEEARLLYVGMTRARERLILVGSPRRLDSALKRWARPATAYAAGSAGCMLDWVMQSLGGFREGQREGKNGSVWRMALQPAEEAAAPVAGKTVLPELSDEGTKDPLTLERMTRRVEARPPLKTSVTAMAKRLRDDRDDWESPADKRRLPEEAPLPRFLQDDNRLTAAQRGTVTHRVLGLLDEALLRAGRLDEALAQLRGRGLLTEEENRVLRRDWLAGFFASDLGKRALAAGTMRREWSFNMTGPYGSMIQGVIDLCFLEDGQWVLADYKTDDADGEELLRRYAPQLQWYAKALAEITGIPVRAAYLFSLRRGESYPVAIE